MSLDARAAAPGQGPAARQGHIVLVGISHRAAPLELRERFAFGPQELPQALAALRADLGLLEAAILSTCNRVEIYASAQEIDGAQRGIEAFLLSRARVTQPELAGRLYASREPHSVRHLFAVASGLDSMVLGESEILHQVKRAYEQAADAGATGKVFHALFQRALNAAKAVRSQTGIGRGATSIGAVAVTLAEKVFGNLRGRRVLLLGAGKVSALTVRRLVERGPVEVRILNRSRDRAAHLAAAYGLEAGGIDELDEQLLEADIVIASTSSPVYVLGREALARVLRTRRHRPLCIVDLGVPRNVAPSAAALENVYLFDLDDLQHLVDHGHEERQQAVEESRAIIDQKVGQFLSWWRREAGGACVPCGLEPAAAP